MIALGTVSIAFLPFWCFDAKGGEVVLLGSLTVGFAWDGHKHVRLSFICACVHLSYVVLNLFALVLCCKTMFLVWYFVWYETMDFIIPMVEMILLMVYYCALVSMS